MSDLVVIVSPAKAEEVRKKLFDLQEQYLIELSRGGSSRCSLLRPGLARNQRSYKTKRRCATVTPNGSIGRSIGYPASFPAAQGGFLRWLRGSSSRWFRSDCC